VSGSPWLDPRELRIGLGCMRLSTEEDRDEELAVRTIVAALDAGITVFDTALAYGRDDSDRGHNERLLARALRRCAHERRARIVTKGGMGRIGSGRVGASAVSGRMGGWVPDGRARTIRADCEESLTALGGLAIDVYLVHAPDPRTPWATSVRALARLAEEGMVRRVGVSNVNRRQLDEALELAPISAVEVALSVHDDRALRGGVLERCEEQGIAVIAHSPLGGPRRAATLGRRQTLTDVAGAHGVTAAEVALAWLLSLSPAVVAIPGARRPETAVSAAQAAALELEGDERDALRRAFGGAREARLGRPGAQDGSEVVVVMGIPGAGKSRLAEEYVAQGYVRLNRDERGASLRELADALEQELSSGTRRVVLDNTYLTRAARSHVIDVAGRRAIPVRCIWLETPLAQAQVNLVERLLDRLGALPSPDELRALSRREPGMLAPTSQMRALRELEPPSSDEGFATVETVQFVRARETVAPRPTRKGVFVAAGALREPGWEPALTQTEPDAPHLLFDWQPAGAAEALEPRAQLLRSVVSGPVHAALCSHAAGPPVCWCRPPLPGLALAFARAHMLDPARSVVIGAGAAHRTLARTLGARYVAV
jgi:aryl-alcohol dehydrogenase-like predicted oxidoreductase/predicted kinase